MSPVLLRQNSIGSARMLALALAIACGAGSTAAHAALPIFGGTVNVAGSPGYTFPMIDSAPGRSAANGVGIGYASKFASNGITDIGNRAIRLRATDSSPGSVNGVELGNLGLSPTGSGISMAYAINTGGVAVGYSRKYTGTTINGFRAVRWDAAGTAAIELTPLFPNPSGVTDNTALAINDAGTIAGYAAKTGPANETLGDRPVRWNSSGTVATVLDTLGAATNGFEYGRPMAINASGVIVGVSNRYESGVGRGGRAVRWSATGTAVTELSGISTATNGSGGSFAFAINDAGTIVGQGLVYSGNTNTGSRAVRWAAGGTTPTELGTLTPAGTDNVTARAISVNATGTAVGSERRSVSGVSVPDRPVRWAAGGTAATPLGLLGTSPTGITEGFAYAINADGYAVGRVLKYNAGVNAGPRAVAWGTDAVAIDLNTLLAPSSGWTLETAVGLRDTGWITGTGSFDPDGPGGAAAYQRHYMMLIPQIGTYGRGDANFDTKTDFADLVILAQKYNLANPTQKTDVADFDLNGVTNFQDLVVLAQHYNSGSAAVDGIGSADFAADWALAQSLVPEPSMISLVAMAAGFGVRRRKPRV